MQNIVGTSTVSEGPTASIQSTDNPTKLNGFAVLDAFGLRIGTVRGARLDQSGEIDQITIVSISSLTRAGIYRVPVSYVSNVNPEVRFIQLARVSRESVSQSLEFAGVAPQECW